MTGFKFESVNLLGSWVFFLLVALFEEILMRGYILGRLLHTCLLYTSNDSIATTLLTLVLDDFTLTVTSRAGGTRLHRP